MITGECYFRDEEGLLWLAQSSIDDYGVVTTTNIFVYEEPAVQEEPTNDPVLVE